MQSLIMALLADTFGVSKANYDILMDILEDETDETTVAEVESNIEIVKLDFDHTRYRLKQ